MGKDQDGLGRVLSIFQLATRGTVVVIDILDGTWRTGDALAASGGRWTIRAVEAIDGMNVPWTASALVLADDETPLALSVGEEVRCCR